MTKMKLLFKTLFLLIIMSCSTKIKTTKMDVKKIIGISMMTTNENGQSYEDMGQLWETFFKVSDKIPNKVSENIYSIYTEYETNYKGKQVAIIGYEVNSFDTIPEGFVGKEIGGGKYKNFLAKGEMPHAVMQTWKEIWQKDDELHRRYTTDFEVYDENSQKGNDSEVEIFIAVK